MRVTDETDEGANFAGTLRLRNDVRRIYEPLDLLVPILRRHRVQDDAETVTSCGVRLGKSFNAKGVANVAQGLSRSTGLTQGQVVNSSSAITYNSSRFINVTNCPLSNTNNISSE